MEAHQITPLQFKSEVEEAILGEDGSIAIGNIKMTAKGPDLYIINESTSYSSQAAYLAESYQLNLKEKGCYLFSVAANQLQIFKLK